ncbi:MAG TPA: efflux RND transporter periplasmic adaptor subunit, partial [Verrucomicrobiae bacterium]|nr:efflux RND transporter periplasmic adaptor subunit [Verrucomicrobiae bacterium]
VKEGQVVKKGDLLLKIKPDFYAAAVNQAKAGYESSLDAKTTAEANLEKADTDFQRNKELYDRKLISDSDFVGFKVARDIAVAQVESSKHQVDMAQAIVASAQDSLDKTVIFAPRDGTVSKLNSQLGERVLGTVQNAGTDIMIISDLNEMEARVDIGEMDVVLIQPGQKAELDVDSFKDRKFAGTVTQIANSSKGMGSLTAPTTQTQDATKFEVRIRFDDHEDFRPGMSVSANIETRYRTNALSVPLAAVTTRPAGTVKSSDTNAVAAVVPDTNTYSSMTAKADKKIKEMPKSVEVVFVTDGDHAKMVPVKIGICDDNYWEVTDGLTDGEEIISGGPKAVNKDLQDASEIVKNGGIEATAKK